VLDNSSMLRLQPSVTAPAVAREAVRRVATHHLQGDVLDVAELLTSELVTNAVRHGTGVVTLAIELAGRSLAVSVGDDAPDVPQVPPQKLLSLGGRGMLMVDSLAGAWGVTPHAGRPGKDVWFRLP
jgi:anti-sigma regulatory factor (Ser/Thr protein kinase)